MLRKQVTLVFCDVAGSTALGEGLDPEALRGVMSRYFDTARAVLEQHGGTVEKYVGDAVMAAFGIPVVHEDDALRATRAADELRRELITLNTELELHFGVRIAVRTGVNTGEVVAGDPALGQDFATGHAVAMTQRLEAAAAPGEVLIGDATYRLVRDAVTVEPVPPLEVKGASEPVLVWRLVDVEPGAHGLGRRLDAPLVGRETELAQLRDAFDGAVAARACRLATILGEPGVGKSRLAAELVHAVGAEALVLEGCCLPYGRGITYWPIVELVRTVAGVQEGDPPAHLRARLAALLGDDPDAAVVAERVAEAAGAGEATTTSDELAWGVRRLFEALARERPLLVVLDDLHWAEATFLDLVEYLVGWTRDAPVLLCVLARPDLLDTRPAWADSTRVTLHGLPVGGARRLAQNLLGPLDDRLLDELVSRAGGNPLFVEETLRMLVDDGSLVRDGIEWRLRREFVRPRVPATVQAVLASRLDRLPAAELAVLQRASVIGQVFWWGAVNALGAPDERSAVGARLHALVRRQLVEPAPSALVAEDSFRFRHILVRDTVYESIAKRERAVLHERFASWVEERARTGAQQFDEILAHHLEQAYRYRVELAPPDEETRALGRRAGAVLAVAGRGALRRGDAPAAANLLGRAAPLVEEERFDLLLELAAALRDAGDFAGAASALEEAAAAAESAGRRALVDVERGWLAFYTDPSQGFDALLDTARAASPLLEREEDERGLVRALLLEAYAQFTSCRVAQMEEVLRRALVHAERTGRRRDTVVVLAGLARAGVVGPAPVEEALGRCRELGARNPGSRWLEGVLESCASYLEAMAGRFEEARALYRLGQETLEEAGQTVALGAACTYAGAAELLAGDAVAAERELRRGFALLEAIEETGNLSTLAAVLAEALGAQGKVGEAAELTRLSEGVASPDDVTSQIAWRSVRARLLAGAGEVEAALALAAEAVALARATDTPNLDAEAHVAHAVALRAAGREEEATAAERRALGSYERKGNVAAVAALGSGRGGGTVVGTEA